ncbi:NAD-dependent epimerase/dehydratase family protein [Embleya scabrispora]|uniref:NAD-dependent epimerase/dehydratase family protein n=1 Tax=Embleya scabrispora TaxID=159449 RepID=UPI0003668AE7|nr:NAD(P)-dependent oxidoreductase [Embleya scabrispora]MYS79617.1 NAD-dependent epimerase/dehydratase family protein [Streptomyces sp. SID5474]
MSGVRVGEERGLGTDGAGLGTVTAEPRTDVAETRITRVLVTGAAGRLGTAVLAELADRGVPVTALVAEDVGEMRADRVVAGDARDPGAVSDALGGVDAVIHLAALASPEVAAPEVVFGTNTQATFVVLNEAGRVGVRRAVLASSLSVTGLPFARSTPRPQPAYLPLDTALPLRVEDPYALSKQVDEATAAMMHRRHGMTAVALRLPFLGDPDRLAGHAARLAGNPALGAPEVWSYLDLRDAARACVLGLTAPAVTGAPVLFVAAPDTLVATPTADLLAAHLPGVPCRAVFPARAVPIDLTPARRLLGFTARHPYLQERT